MKYIFMNHRIRDKDPKDPVIVVQEKDLQIHSNRIDLYVNGKKIGSVKFHNKGLKTVNTHHVRAWVELNDVVETRIK